MQKFRRKPIEVEAVQLTVENIGEVAKWCNGCVKEMGRGPRQMAIDIPSPEGGLRALIGDWIIKGVNGEFELYWSDVFDANYEPIDG